MHVDYLNHRGEGKENAELIYFADVRELATRGMRVFADLDGVRDNWVDRNGKDDPPR